MSEELLGGSCLASTSGESLRNLCVQLCVAVFVTGRAAPVVLVQLAAVVTLRVAPSLFSNSRCYRSWG